MTRTVEVQTPRSETVTCNVINAACDVCDIEGACVVLEYDGLVVCPTCVRVHMESAGYMVKTFPFPS